MIKFEIFDGIMCPWNQFRCDSLDCDNKFVLKKSIKRQFEYDSKQILGLSQCNRLSLAQKVIVHKPFEWK